MSYARECAGKQSHPHRAAAVEAGRWRRERFGARLADTYPYHCRHCGAWHIGHRPRRRR